MINNSNNKQNLATEFSTRASEFDSEQTNRCNDCGAQKKARNSQRSPEDAEHKSRLQMSGNTRHEFDETE